MVSIDTDRNGVYKNKNHSSFLFDYSFIVTFSKLRKHGCVFPFSSLGTSAWSSVSLYLSPPMCGRTEIEKYTLLIMSFSNLFLHFFGKEWTWLCLLELKFKAEEFFCDKYKDLYWYNNHTEPANWNVHTFSHFCVLGPNCVCFVCTQKVPTIACFCSVASFYYEKVWLILWCSLGVKCRNTGVQLHSCKYRFLPSVL